MDNSIPVACYAYSSDPQHFGNPLIEALPSFQNVSSRDIAQALRHKPEQLNKIANRRQRSLFLMALAVHTFIPLARHIQAHTFIDLMIRLGYSNRNPLQREDPSGPAGGKIKSYSHARSSMSMAIIGCSGIGKTFSVDQILGLYPQALLHQAGQVDPEKPVIQVVYLKVECPPDGSMKSLCASVIAELDRVVNQGYVELFLNSKRITLEILRERMTHLLNLHRVGLLVLDEAQNLVRIRQNHDVLFNFLVSLTNTLQVPILYIGTPKVVKFMQKDLRIARRFGNCGALFWDRLKRPDNGQKDEWDSFIDELWSYRVLKKDLLQIPADVEDALYNLSQGVIDILIKLFVLSEMRALELGMERLTVGIIEAIYKEHFGSVAPMLDALRRNDVEALIRYEDIRLPDTNFQEAMKVLATEVTSKTQAEQALSDVPTENLVEELFGLLQNARFSRTPELEEMIKSRIRSQTLADPAAVLMAVVEKLAAASVTLPQQANPSDSAPADAPIANAVETAAMPIGSPEDVNE